MELAIPFKLHNKPYNDIAKEFNIKYNEENNSKERLKDFVKMYDDKRINIETQNFDLELFQELNELNQNIAIRLTSLDQIAWLYDLKESNIKFFFDSKIMAATDMYSLNYLIDLGVSDIYISNLLFYSLSKLKIITESQGIQIRFILNRIASTLPIKDIEKAPWFPPDAYEIANHFIDIYEFDCGDPYEWNRFHVYYKTWIEKQEWYGDLSELMPELELWIPDTGLFGFDWLKYKTKCEFKCVNPNWPCTKCEQFIEIAETLAEKGIAINRK